MSAEVLIQIGIAVVTVIVAIVGGYWGLAKLVIAQFNAGLDVRFDALERARQEGRKANEERFQRMENKHELLEKDVRAILVELPRDYMRREDHIRDIGTIALKIENLALNVERNLKEQGAEMRDIFQREVRK